MVNQIQGIRKTYSQSKLQTDAGVIEEQVLNLFLIFMVMLRLNNF